MEVNLKYIRSILGIEDEAKGDEKAQASAMLDVLYADQGLVRLKNWYLDVCQDDFTVDEILFFNLARRMSGASDAQILNFFDLLDLERRGALGVHEVFIFIALCCAYAANELLKFLYQHGETLFSYVCQPNQTSARFQEAKALAYALGVMEEQLKDVQVYCHFEGGDLLDLERFLLLYYALFRNMERVKLHSHPVRGETVPAVVQRSLVMSELAHSGSSRSSMKKQETQTKCSCCLVM